MKKSFDRVILKIRLWNPRYFVNPFFSPSLYMAVVGKKIVDEICEQYLVYMNDLLKYIKEMEDKKL